MATTFLESGASATFGLQFWDATSLAAVVTTPVFTGPRSIQMPGYSSVRKDSATFDAGTRINFRANFSSVSSTTRKIVEPNDTGVGVQFRLKLTSTGLLQLFYPDAHTKDGTTALSVDTWYRIGLCYKITGPNTGEIRVFLNGALEITDTNPASINLGSGTRQLFFYNELSGATWYLSDIYFDDSAALTDPGDIRVTAKLPAANNTNSYNTAVGANPANRWENVNERALSETNGWQETGSTGVQENFGLQTAAGGDIDLSTATLIARSAWIWAKISSASVLSKIMDNGTETAVTLTTTSALYTLITDSASYPSNAAGIGARSSTTPNTFLYECGTLIAYKPSIAVIVSAGFINVGCPVMVR